MSAESLSLLIQQMRQYQCLDSEKSLTLALEAEAMSRTLDNDTALLDALLCACGCLVDLEKNTELLSVKIDEALRLCPQIGTAPFYAEALYLQGWLHLLRYQPAEAEAVLVQALEWQTEAGLLEWKVVTLRVLGNTYIDMGRYPTALKMLCEALTLGEEIGFDRIDRFFHSQGHHGRADIFHGIGIVYSNMDQFARAITYYEIALELYEKNGSVRAAKTLYNMGIAAQEMGKQEQALIYYRCSYTLETARGCDNGAAVALNGIAEIHMQLGQLEAAWVSLQEAESRLANDEVNKAFYADILWSMGDYRLRQHRPAEALDYFYRTLEIHEATDRASGQFSYLHQEMSEAHKALGEFEKALAHFERFHALQTEHMEASWTEQMRQAMVQFDTERALKDREVLHLHSKELEREIAERKEAQNALAKAKLELEDRNRALALLSRRDPLTGLHNRRFLDDTIELLLSIGRKTGEPVSVALCDIDNFKQVNDTLSHTVGDDVLRIVAEILSASLRRSDVAVRYGGEEFVAVFPNTDEDTAALLMDQFRSQVAGYNWSQIAESLHVTISTGVASQTSHVDSYSLLQDADSCLYYAKRRGKNQVIRTAQRQVDGLSFEPFAPRTVTSHKGK